MRGWKRSNLVMGELLRVPKQLFIVPETAPKRLLSVAYVGENDTGIFIDASFKPGPCTKDPDKWHYKMHINWASIWCGQVKIYREDDTLVRAYRCEGQPLALCQKSLTFD